MTVRHIIKQPMSSWLLQMFWCWIGTKPSAATMLTSFDSGIRIPLHNTGGCHYNTVQYNMIFHTTLQWLRHYQNQRMYSTKDTPYLTLTDKLWGVYCEDFRENIYNTAALYRYHITDMKQATGMLTLNVRGPSYLSVTRSISWLLMPWLLTSPGHQQSWYWSYTMCRSFSYLRKDFKYLCQINVEEWQKRNYMFMFPLKNLACKGLNSLWTRNTIWWHRIGSTLSHVMACCLTTWRHHLDQCWLFISRDPWHLSESNFTRDISAINH